MKTYKIEFSTEAKKELKKLSKPVAVLIAKKLKLLSLNPFEYNSIKLKETLKAYRIRIGTYRVIYEVESDKLIIFVIRIAHRKESYKNL